MENSEKINIEREKSNLFYLNKLILNTLIDVSSSGTSLDILDDHHLDVTNFILILERILNFRMKANWLSERRSFWDFARPACINSSRATIIDRVEEISKNKTLKEKGRLWIKFALMEKKLSELLKLMISDCHLVRKYYHDDSIMSSSQGFIVCDQLACLNTIDFSFCFKQNESNTNLLFHSNSDIDVIDLTPFLCYKSQSLKRFLMENKLEENKQPTPILSSINEMKPINSGLSLSVSIEKYKLVLEQRKYFEELLKERDRECQQIKDHFDKLKSERDKEVTLMENIIIELQFQVDKLRTELDSKQKKIQNDEHLLDHKNKKMNFRSNPIQTENQDFDETEMNSVDATIITDIQESSPLIDTNSPTYRQDNEILKKSETYQSFIDTTTTTIDNEQYELVENVISTRITESFSINNQDRIGSSPEMISSTTSISSSSSDLPEMHQKQSENDQLENPSIYQSGHFQPIQIHFEQNKSIID